MLALIDGDIILYRTGWASETEPESIACVRADETVKNILRDTGATSFQIWFSDTLERNFRYQIDRGYKLSRQSQPKPKHYQALKYFLVKEWNAQITEGQEADDALGIGATQTAVDGSGDEAIICSIDKDLLQIPGHHYNFVKKELREVTEDEGIRFFYKQLLIGDRIDDISGVRGIGKVRAGRLLDECPVSELFQKVRFAYADDERLLKNGKLLWIRRKPNEIWEFPSENSETNLQDEGRIDGDSVDGYGSGEEAASGVLLQR